MLYFAYGANLNPRGMKRRCPQAVPQTTATLKGYRLEFRTFLTIVPDQTCEVHGALFALTPACWRALDAYEGRDYEKTAVCVQTPEGPREATAYIMAGGERAPPSMAYFTEIARGYADWKLDVEILRRARITLLHPTPKQARPRS